MRTHHASRGKTELTTAKSGHASQHDLGQSDHALENSCNDATAYYWNDLPQQLPYHRDAGDKDPGGDIATINPIRPAIRSP